METGRAMSVALALRGIRKTFPGVVAVDGVDLDVRRGEIHALVGENGAGKSTLARIAFGELHADAGSVEAHGTVGLVHQHFELVGRLRVWQNVLLGREPRTGWRIDTRAARARVTHLAQRNGLSIDPDALVEDLPVGMRQRVELLRELERDPAVLLLDEPTAALAPGEIDAFFATIEQLAHNGTAVLVVTHKLNEVMEHAQRVTVMRHGKIVEQTQIARTSAREIAQAMVGGELPAIAQRAATVLAPCLSIRDLRTAGAAGLRGVDLDVRRGEIVGIAGVEGNGQSALADAIAGMITHAGTVAFASPHTTVGIVPQDRAREALVLGWSLVENVAFSRFQNARMHAGPFVNFANARTDAQTIAQRFDVRAATLDVPVATLSGGNQQKIVVGRALVDHPEFLLAYNPTRGIDVGAAALVQSRLVQARNDGAAILLISFELDEILALADRVLVLFNGSIAGAFDGASADRGELGRLMAGGA